MIRRLGRSAWWALTLASLTACSYSCTAIGCVGSLTVALSGFPSGVGPVRIHMCAGQSCVDQERTQLPTTLSMTVEPPALPMGQGREGPVPTTASLRITRAGVLLVDSTVPVTYESSAPNGERRGPICYAAQLSASPAGLVGSAVSSP